MQRSMGLVGLDRAARVLLLGLAAVLVLGGVSSHRAVAAEGEWKSIFDGHSLKDWDGDPKFWRIEDGCITGETTYEMQPPYNTFMIWRGGTPGDFELTAEYKIRHGLHPGFQPNSGIQYRSFDVNGKKWAVHGYQGDIEAGDTFSGIIYGEGFRGILCLRGQKTVIGPDHKPKVVEQFGKSEEIQSHIKKDDWNTYHITARGFHFEQRINGVLTAVCDDEDTKVRRHDGIIALQLHKMPVPKNVHEGPAMKVQFRNIKIRLLKPAAESSSTQEPVTRKKKIVFIAGTPSHGFAQHEHRAGCLLLAKALNENVPQVHAEVVTNGWPKNPHILDDADCIVVYADGGEHHPFYKHLDEIDALMKKGVGLVCIHYATEVPKGKSGELMSEWTGAYFEPSWSVNPHWTAHYKHLPKHEVTRGVHPFTINDEWYYHVRFLGNDSGPGVTRILEDVPPASSLNRPDSPYGGNPAVRAAVANKEPQAMAWAHERPEGGRGFGITGGHFHWNWGNDNFRKLVLNAIVWAAHVPVPADGVYSRPLTVEDLEANLDKTKNKVPPPDFNPARIQALLDQWRAESGS